MNEPIKQDFPFPEDTNGDAPATQPPTPVPLAPEGAIIAAEPAGPNQPKAPTSEEQDASAAIPASKEEEVPRQQGTAPVQAPEASPDDAVLAASRRHTRRSFAVAALGAAAGYGFYRWLPRSPADDDQPVVLRRAFQVNAGIARALFNDRVLAPTYPLKRAETLRVNGILGLKKTLVPESWRLQLVGARDAEHHPRFTKDVTAWEYRYTQMNTHEDQGHDTKVAPSANTAEKMATMERMPEATARQERTKRTPRGQEEAGESDSTLQPGTSGLLMTMDDVKKLPRHELVTEFKCIEGWSQVVHWAGVRMADFLELYPPAMIDGREPRYVYMETPDGDYYTGYDMHAMRHPQTLLVTEMMGAPLTQYHGAPLRLHMPIKYGYKQIKRIGLINYTNDLPDDYWTKLGYDWYAGL